MAEIRVSNNPFEMDKVWKNPAWLGPIRGTRNKLKIKGRRDIIVFFKRIIPTLYFNPWVDLVKLANGCSYMLGFRSNGRF